MLLTVDEVLATAVGPGERSMGMAVDAVHRRFWSTVFDLLIAARNSKDEEALQEAIDIAAKAACRSLDF